MGKLGAAGLSKFCSSGMNATKRPTPKRPKTMEGTPARLRMARRMNVTNRPWVLYSFR